MWTLYKKIEYHGKGCPEDDSERWDSVEHFILIEDRELDDFSEIMASDYGNQDYSYNVKYDKVLELSDNELKILMYCISEKMFNNALKKESSENS